MGFWRNETTDGSAKPVNMDNFDYGPSKKSDPRGSWRHRVASLRYEWGSKCQKCGVAEKFDKKDRSNLEFAHKEPTGLNGRGRGQTQRFQDIMKHPKAYELLCKKCHKQ